MRAPLAVLLLAQAGFERHGAVFRDARHVSGDFAARANMVEKKADARRKHGITSAFHTRTERPAVPALSREHERAS